jgi:hypothetical protein
MSDTAGAAVVPLSKGFGYGIILGLGFAFALGMIGTTWALKRYHGEVSELPLCAMIALLNLTSTGSNLGGILDSWPNSQIGSCCRRCGVQLDMGCDSPAVFGRCLQIWSLRYVKNPKIVLLIC